MNAMDTTTRRDVIRGGFCMAAASALGGCITGKPACTGMLYDPEEYLPAKISDDVLKRIKEIENNK